MRTKSLPLAFLAIFALPAFSETVTVLSVEQVSVDPALQIEAAFAGSASSGNARCSGGATRKNGGNPCLCLKDQGLRSAINQMNRDYGKAEQHWETLTGLSSGEKTNEVKARREFNSAFQDLSILCRAKRIDDPKDLPRALTKLDHASAALTARVHKKMESEGAALHSSGEVSDQMVSQESEFAVAGGYVTIPKKEIEYQRVDPTGDFDDYGTGVHIKRDASAGIPN